MPATAAGGVPPPSATGGTAARFRHPTCRVTQPPPVAPSGPHGPPTRRNGPRGRLLPATAPGVRPQDRAQPDATNRNPPAQRLHRPPAPHRLLRLHLPALADDRPQEGE